MTIIYPRHGIHPRHHRPRRPAAVVEPCIPTLADRARLSRGDFVETERRYRAAGLVGFDGRAKPGSSTVSRRTRSRRYGRYSPGARGLASLKHSAPSVSDLEDQGRSKPDLNPSTASKGALSLREVGLRLTASARAPQSPSSPSRALV